MTHREEPGAGVQALQLRPGEHGSRDVGQVGEDLMDVGGPLKGVVVHQEGNPVDATTMRTALTRVAVKCCNNINLPTRID